MNNIEGETYRERVISQTTLWFNGKSLHNDIDGECCPDFSCCEPELFTIDEKERTKIYLNSIISAVPKLTNWYKYVIVPVV